MPSTWLLDTFRALEEFVTEADTENLYDIRFSFPGDDLERDKQPPSKTIIHFEIDDNDPRPLGFGRGIVQETFNEITGQLTETEATIHRLNFDIGIWASGESGGTTGRLEAYQFVLDLFVGPSAFEIIRDVVGAEVVSFSGGAFVRDTVGDIPLWRVAGMSLILRVFGKKVLGEIPYIDEINQTPGIYIQDTVPIPIEP